jgi:hypothetical protein
MYQPHFFEKRGGIESIAKTGAQFAKSFRSDPARQAR